MHSSRKKPRLIDKPKSSEVPKGSQTSSVSSESDVVLPTPPPPPASSRASPPVQPFPFPEAFRRQSSRPLTSREARVILEGVRDKMLREQERKHALQKTAYSTLTVSFFPPGKGISPREDDREAPREIQAPRKPAPPPPRPHLGVKRAKALLSMTKEEREEFFREIADSYKDCGLHRLRHPHFDMSATTRENAEALRRIGKIPVIWKNEVIEVPGGAEPESEEGDARDKRPESQNSTSSGSTVEPAIFRKEDFPDDPRPPSELMDDMSVESEKEEEKEEKQRQPSPRK